MNSDGENAGAAFVGIVAGIIMVTLLASCAPDDTTTCHKSSSNTGEVFNLTQMLDDLY